MAINPCSIRKLFADVVPALAQALGLLPGPLLRPASPNRFDDRFDERV